MKSRLLLALCAIGLLMGDMFGIDSDEYSSDESTEFGVNYNARDINNVVTSINDNTEYMVSNRANPQYTYSDSSDSDDEEGE